MVWFQAFEYAIGHWFQKSAEHVLGCVLCSPGCFSLIRVEYLMRDNVMATYRGLAKSPFEKLMYDQARDQNYELKFFFLYNFVLKNFYILENDYSR